MAYGATVLKGQIASVAAAVSAGSMDTSTNTTGTSGFGTALAGQVKTVAEAASAGTQSIDANAQVS